MRICVGILRFKPLHFNGVKSRSEKCYVNPFFVNLNKCKGL
nr:MAG TPA: hypothetical protein [Caudoviricetes sp.]